METKEELELIRRHGMKFIVEYSAGMRHTLTDQDTLMIKDGMRWAAIFVDGEGEAHDVNSNTGCLLIEKEPSIATLDKNEAVKLADKMIKMWIEFKKAALHEPPNHKKIYTRAIARLSKQNAGKCPK